MMWSPQKIPSWPPYILSWEGCFKQNMMIWNFPPFLQNTDVVAAVPWQMLSIPFHTYRPGRFPMLPKPIWKAQVSTRCFLNLSRSRSQLNIWMVRCEDIVTLGAPPAATHQKGFVFIWEFPETFTCHCVCWSIPHHNWNTCFFRSYNLSFETTKTAN